jgi:hypothetical protein
MKRGRRLIRIFRQWSLGGFSEQASFQIYLGKLAAAQAALASFYEARFCWDQKRAAAILMKDPNSESFGAFWSRAKKPVFE